MENQEKKKAPVLQAILASLVVGALALGALAAAPAVAQAQEATPEAPSAAPPRLEGMGRPDFGPGGHSGWEGGSEFDIYLAEALGISLDELQAARAKAQEAALQAAVDSGKLTAEQADMMQARQALMKYIDREALTAQALGITVEDLQAARQAGKSISTLIQELGLDAEQVQAAYETAYKAAVAQAVQSGIITQAQADQILSQEKGFDLFGRGRHGHNRPGPGMNEAPPAPQGGDTGTDNGI